MTSFFLSAEILNVHQIMEWAILGNSTNLIRTDTKNLTDLEKKFFVKGFYVIYTISILPVTSCSDYNDGLLTTY